MEFEKMGAFPAPKPPEKQREPDPPSYEGTIKFFVGNDTTVSLRNADQFRAGQSRFLYGFTEGRDKKYPGFVKLARIDDQSLSHHQLKRESAVMAGISQIGVPSLRQIVPYRETADGHALICIEKLDLEEGELLSNAEFIASAPPEYGEWAAHTIGLSAGKEIPTEVDTRFFKTDDGRNESTKTFDAVWQESVKKTLDLPEDEQKILSSQELFVLKKLANSMAKEMHEVLNASHELEKHYFVHNDASPGNMFFKTKDESALLLDFEHSGVTHNKLLAILTDVGNFYGRTWPNPAMQEKFLMTLMDSGDLLPDRNLRHKIVKMAAVFGALYLAKYAMDPAHKEHRMTKSLLKNLPGHLQKLESLTSE